VELLTIGAFARLAKLTPRALRLYDESGLLPPAAVDADSAYRFYAPEQVFRARLIARLRRIGMPLAEIRAVCVLPPAGAARSVEEFWRRETVRTAARAGEVALLVADLSRRDPDMSEITIRHAGRCETGAVRDTNQDAVLATDTVLAVADGGGGPAGAAASRAAVDALARLDVTAPALLTALAGAVDEVDRALRGSGITTLTGLLRHGTRLALVHIGDTRAYLLRGGELSQLTQDHTWVQDQVDRGKLPAAEAASHPQRALLVRALGGGPQPVEADLGLRTALPGDRYLLCSDGLSAVVDRAALHKALIDHTDPAAAVEHLVALAVEAGAPDNIACVVADVVTADRTG
jgi:serine/threonine protein phosphatase PrpC